VLPYEDKYHTGGATVITNLTQPLSYSFLPVALASCGPVSRKGIARCEAALRNPGSTGLEFVPGTNARLAAVNTFYCGVNQDLGIGTSASDDQMLKPLM